MSKITNPEGVKLIEPFKIILKTQPKTGRISKNFENLNAVISKKGIHLGRVVVE
jgi:hypothetical protein